MLPTEKNAAIRYHKEDGLIVSSRAFQGTLEDFAGKAAPSARLDGVAQSGRLRTTL